MELLPRLFFPSPAQVGSTVSYLYTNTCFPPPPLSSTQHHGRTYTRPRNLSFLFYMLKSVLAVLSVFAASAFACEPDCRHGLANAFAGHYAPVVQLAVDELEYTFSTSLFNVSVPEEVSTVVPEQALQKGVTASLKETLQIFVDWAAEKPLEDGIYRVMFAEKDPFKGDCNNPKRLDRKMPPEGESWRRDECK